MTKKIKIEDTKLEMFGYIINIDQYCNHYEHSSEQYGNWSESHTNTLNRTANKTTEFPVVVSIHDIPSGSNALVVWAEWSTGDSFGKSSGGAAEVIGIFKDLDSAASLRNQIEDHTKNRKSGEYGYKFETPDGQIFESGFAPWTGYFETLESVNVDTVVVW